MEKQGRLLVPSATTKVHRQFRYVEKTASRKGPQFNKPDQKARAIFAEVQCVYQDHLVVRLPYITVR